MERYLIEKAYACAKQNFKKSYFTFKDLYDILSKQEPSIKLCSADLYTEIIQDIRFISLGKQKWALRENFTVAEINKITSSIFGLEEYHEEDADQYMSEAEKKELKSKIEREENELMLDDELDDDDNIKKPNMRKIGTEESEDEIEKSTSIDSIRSISEIDDDESSDIDDEDDDDSILGVEDDEEDQESESDDEIEDDSIDEE